MSELRSEPPSSTQHRASLRPRESRRVASLLGALGSIAALHTGCTVRADFTPATGEKLGYHDKSGTYQQMEEVETGAVYNSAGEKVLTSTEQQAVTHSYRELWPTQGGVQIDEESFFRIANDEEAVKKYDEWHQDGLKKTRNGVIMVAVGATVAAAGLAVLGYGLETKTDKDPKQPFVIGGGVGAGAGALVTLLGIPLISTGRHQATTTDGTLFDDPGRYRADARRYNRELRAR